VTDDQIFYHCPGVSKFEESERISEKLLQLLSLRESCLLALRADRRLTRKLTQFFQILYFPLSKTTAEKPFSSPFNISPNNRNFWNVKKSKPQIAREFLEELDPLPLSLDVQKHFNLIIHV
jgi:hypothetical protein